MPLRAALPTLMLFDIEPRLSTRPPACTEALPSAQAIRVASSPSSVPIAAAAPNTPQVEVMCQPRR